MTLTEKRQQQAIIISIDGRLDTTNYQQLETKILQHLEQNHTMLVIDCSGMDYVSSAGLRIFLVALKKLTAVGGQLALCALRQNIKEIFDISGFTGIFKIYATQQQALQALGQVA